jgi:hypothetical protein
VVWLVIGTSYWRFYRVGLGADWGWCGRVFELWCLVAVMDWVRIVSSGKRREEKRRKEEKEGREGREISIFLINAQTLLRQ